MRLASVPSGAYRGNARPPGPVSRSEYIGLALSGQRMVPCRSCDSAPPLLRKEAFMTRTPLLAVVALSSVTLLGGCDSAKTAPTAPRTAPRFNFINGPGELTNVIRFSTDRALAYIVDPASGLVAVEGLPATDPNSFCGAEDEQQPGSTLTWQQVGWLRGVIRTHVVGQDVTIHVFNLSDLDASQPDPFLDLWCTGTPIASGTGKAMAVDNDFFATGGKTDAFTIRIQGTVTDLRTGESLRLTAESHAVVNLAGYPAVDPTVKVENAYVRLTPFGGR